MPDLARVHVFQNSEEIGSFENVVLSAIEVSVTPGGMKKFAFSDVSDAEHPLQLQVYGDNIAIIVEQQSPEDTDDSEGEDK